MYIFYSCISDGKILTTLVGPNVIVEEAEESPDFVSTCTCTAVQILMAFT